MTGLGGDMFAILWSEREQRLVGINGSGRAGSLMTREALGGSVEKRARCRSRSRARCRAGRRFWRSYGTVTLAEALRPAVILAQEGFPVSKTTASEWALFADDLVSDPGARETYLIDGDRAPQAGEWFSNPDLAKYDASDRGRGPRSALWRGTRSTHRRACPGTRWVSDDRGFRPAQIGMGRASLRRRSRTTDSGSCPPNGQGIAALEMLRLLEPYDLASMGHNSADYLHHLIEAKKLAYADLEHFVGDPDFMAIEPERLLADDFITARRAHLSPERALRFADSRRSLTQSETTYLAVADEEGNMVSFINSLAGAFGSGVVVPGTGFALQNRAPVSRSEKDERTLWAREGGRSIRSFLGSSRRPARTGSSSRGSALASSAVPNSRKPTSRCC